MNTVDIQTFDIDKYLDWLFSLPNMEENVKKIKEKTPVKITWFPFTDKGKELVKKGRLQEYNNHLERFLSSVEGSPLPIKEIAKDEFNGIQEIYHTIFHDVHNTIIRGCVVYDWYELAGYCGYVDFLKYLLSYANTDKQKHITVNNSLSRIERMLLFFYLIKANIVLNQRISQDNKKQSFIIGLLIGQSTEYKQYQDNNTMRKDWALIQKELANPTISNSIATKNRLENLKSILEKDRTFINIIELIDSDLVKLF